MRNPLEFSLEEIEKFKVSNIIKYYNFKNAEDFYLQYYKTEAPKCLYCDNKAKFKSFKEGYFYSCDYNKHKNELSFLSLENKRKNQKIYQEFVKNNLNFYKNITFPFIDIYDNKEVKSLYRFKIKYGDNAEKIFLDEQICECCKKKFHYKKLKNQIFCKDCKNFIKHNPQFSKYYQIISKNIFRYYKKYKRISIEKLIEYSEKYDENTLKDFCIGNAIIINDTLLTRKQINYNFSYLRNNIILDEMLEKCKNCNEEYIKYDFVYDEKEQKMIKIKIGADFSCGKLECYRNCVTFYNHSEETKIKQSKTMKSKIKNGDFTPQITNSWTHHNNKFVYNHINFRSSWELLFYLLNYKKYNLKFEKIRIPYYDTLKNKMRIYIADFFDEDNKIVYEIKPSEHIKFNLDKIIWAKKYCQDNNYKFELITNEYFINNFNLDIYNYIDKDNINYFKKLFKQFENKRREDEN